MSRPRALFLRAGFLAFFIVLMATVVVFAPLILATFAFGLSLETLKAKATGKRAGPVVGAFLLVFFASLVMAGMMAPVRLLSLAPYFLLGKPAGGLWEALVIGKDWFLPDRAIGILGILAVAGWLLIDAVWRWRQASQVRNLPTSKVRSLALGLVEIKGVVRTADGGSGKTVVEARHEVFDFLNLRQRIEPFYLDDGTGRVLVDPRSCRVRAGWLNDLGAVFGVRELVLSRRVARDERTGAVTRSLRDGDRVYLIGTAEENPQASAAATGADRLVIRPAERTNWNATLWSTLFGSIRPPRGKDIHDVFFLIDGSEEKAHAHILAGFRTVVLLACFWLAASATLLWSTTLPQRTEYPLDSWRVAYWRGPQPHWDRHVVDFEKNRQVYRFEKWLASAGASSPAAIPLLSEALTVDNSFMKEKATGRLIELLPEGGAAAQLAMAPLIANLSWYDAHVVRASINALALLGPDAAAAVPALIGQLNCEKTNTYEVSCAILREEAAIALGNIGTGAAEAIPALQSVVDDHYPFVREAAAKALRQIDPRLQSGSK